MAGSEARPFYDIFKFIGTKLNIAPNNDLSIEKSNDKQLCYLTCNIIITLKSEVQIDFDG